MSESVRILSRPSLIQNILDLVAAKIWFYITEERFPSISGEFHTFPWKGLWILKVLRSYHTGNSLLEAYSPNPCLWSTHPLLHLLGSLAFSTKTLCTLKHSALQTTSVLRAAVITTSIYLQINSVIQSPSLGGGRRFVLPLNPNARVGCQFVFADRRVCQSPIPVSESNNKRLKWDHLTITHPAVSRLPGHLKRRNLSSHVMETSRTMTAIMTLDLLLCFLWLQIHKLHTWAVSPDGRTFYTWCLFGGNTGTEVRCRLPWIPWARALSWVRCPVRKRPRAWTKQWRSTINEQNLDPLINFPIGRI